MKTRLLIIGVVFALTLFSSLMIPTFAVHTGEGNHPTPHPSLCKSGPMPDGRGWVFIDCNWEQYADVHVDNCMRGKTPANNYAWNTQDCLWEWSPMRNENATGPHMGKSPNDDPICGGGTELVDGICQVRQVMLVKTIGDDAPFFGIFVYVDNLFSWIMGK